MGRVGASQLSKALLCASFSIYIYKSSTFSQLRRVSVIIIMSGVWEALFQEEKQDWIACITGCVTALLNLILEAPCTILALISTALILAWDFTCETAKQVSDLLALEEWW